MDIGLSRDLDINVGLSGDLLMDVGLSGNLDINIGLSRDLNMDIGLSSRVGIGIGHRGVIGSTIDSSIDSGGSGISGNWGSSISSRGSSISSGGTHNSTSGSSSVGEGTSVAIASVGNHLSLGHGGTESDNSDKSLHYDSDLRLATTEAND